MSKFRLSAWVVTWHQEICYLSIEMHGWQWTILETLIWCNSGSKKVLLFCKYLAIYRTCFRLFPLWWIQNAILFLRGEVLGDVCSWKVLVFVRVQPSVCLCFQLTEIPIPFAALISQSPPYHYRVTTGGYHHALTNMRDTLQHGRIQCWATLRYQSSFKVEWCSDESWNKWCVYCWPQQYYRRSRGNKELGMGRYKWQFVFISHSKIDGAKAHYCIATKFHQ